MPKRLEELTSEDRFLIERVAREKAKLRLLSEIRMTLEICDLEGWDKSEFIKELQELINSFKLK